MASWKSDHADLGQLHRGGHYVGAPRHRRELVGEGLIKALGGSFEGNVELLGEFGDLAGERGEAAADLRRDGLDLGDPPLELDGLLHGLAQGVPNLAHGADDKLRHYHAGERAPGDDELAGLVVGVRDARRACVAGVLDLAAGVRGRGAHGFQGIVEPLGLALHAGREPESRSRRGSPRGGSDAPPALDMASAIWPAAEAIAFICATAPPAWPFQPSSVCAKRLKGRAGGLQRRVQAF